MKGETALQGIILAVGLVIPFIFPTLTVQATMLWIMILFALTWDMMGGQMGYNSLGNIAFFGFGMYICAIVQVGLYYDVGAYTSPFDQINATFTPGQYYTGLALGIIAAAVGCVIIAFILSSFLFGLRGPYFAIGTLGVALSAGELMGAWEYIGAGSGIALPVFPASARIKGLTFYYLALAAAIATFLFVKWLYATRWGLSINAIRDDEEKAEAMGIHTKRYKSFTWAFSAFFLGISGALFGNMTGFIEPLEVAFPTVTFGIFMVAMALLGGKGTLWGPVLGATAFHVVKEVTWTYLLGWQWVALGLLIVVNVVFFQDGAMGWMQRKWPERFGVKIDARMSKSTDASKEGSA
ncbi:MAG: branched-chain amino acid ABC transporter permease [Proteobacteria bacterium]|nr:MAG: branched-chain amino acid ABC transporter permease [Pseudomonadota bacterium]